MAETKQAKGKAKGGPLGVLTRKAGPLPVGVWALLVIGLYLAYRHYAGATANAAATTPAASNTAGTVGTPSDQSGSGGGASSGQGLASDGLALPTGPDYSQLLTSLIGGQQQLADELAAFQTPTNSVDPNAGTAGATSNGWAGAQLTGTVIDPATGTTTNRAGYPTNTSYADLGVAPAPITSDMVSPIRSGAATVTVKPPPMSSLTLPAHQPGYSEPPRSNANAVASVKHLSNGATLTTYANGRQVEQAKGKTPYVVKKGHS